MGNFLLLQYGYQETHKQLNYVFGAQWKDEYVVWDCAWGTGNLTRDYYFKELYASTLDKIDLDLVIIIINLLISLYMIF